MKRLYMVVFFCAIFGVSAFSQDRGIIQCSPTLDRIPAWDAPGGTYLVQYLTCRQIVSIAGRERGYVRIQIGGHDGYVESQHVRMMTTQQPRPSPRPSSRRFEPKIPTAEIFVGYSYLNFDTSGFADSRHSANGWEASVSANFNKWFAMELDISGHYKNYNYYTGNVPGLPSVVSVPYYREYSYLAGPRLNYGSVFVHALFGGDRLSGSALETSSPQTGFAGLLGGGIQYPMNDKIAFRAGLDYAFSEHNFQTGSSVTRIIF